MKVRSLFLASIAAAIIIIASFVKNFCCVAVDQPPHRKLFPMITSRVAPTTAESSALAHYAMGMIYDNEGNINKALSEYKKALTYDDTSSFIHTRIGAAYLLKNKPEEAIYHLSIAKKHSPGNAKVHVLLALIYTSQKKFEDATREYQEIIKLKPGSVEALTSLADLYVIQEKMEEAAGVYEKLLETEEDLSPSLHFNLALIYSRIGKLDSAADELKTVIELKPDYIEAYLALGVLYELKKDPQTGTSYYEEALKIDPLNEKVYRHLGSVYYQQKRVGEAIRQYQYLLKIYPKNLDGYVELSYIYLSEKKPEEAMEVLKTAEDLGLESERFLLACGFAKSAVKDYEGAIGYYEKVIKGDPDNARGHFYLGAAYERTGRKDKATTEFRRCIELDPKFADAYNYLGYMFAEEGINLDEAISLIRKALEFDSENGAYIDSLGWAYFKKGLIDKALVELERAVQFVEDDAVIHEHLGDVYYRKGQIDKAGEAWKRSLELDPKQENVKEKLERK